MKWQYNNILSKTWLYKQNWKSCLTTESVNMLNCICELKLCKLKLCNTKFWFRPILNTPPKNKSKTNILIADYSSKLAILIKSIHLVLLYANDINQLADPVAINYARKLTSNWPQLPPFWLAEVKWRELSMVFRKKNVTAWV